MCNPTKKLKPTSKLKWAAILADEYLIEDFTLKTFIKAEVCNTKLLSKLINKLQEIYPMNNTYRYKRVKKLLNDKEPSGESKIGKFEVLLTEKENFKGLPETLDDLLRNVEAIELPTDKVLTRKQFDVVSRNFWPCSFHFNKYLESLIDRTYFESTANTQIVDMCDTYARLVVKLANFKGTQSAAIVVDPRENR